MRALVDKYNSLGEAQKKRGLIASLIVLGLLGIWLSSQEDTESAGPLIPPEIITPVSSNIYVHVVGEVSAPGLYQLPVGSRASGTVAGKVSLNRGDRADFESLSGIGPKSCDDGCFRDGGTLVGERHQSTSCAESCSHLLANC